MTWAAFRLPASSPAQFAENVHWFGEEVVAKVRGSATVAAG